MLDFDKTVREEFGRLIKKTQTLYEENRDAPNFEGNALAEFTEIKTSTTTLVYQLVPDIALKGKFNNDIKNLSESIDGATKLQGILKALQRNYKIGLLNLSTKIEANVALDYMSLAEQLLGESISERYDYVPAAVLAGAVLEDALRRLCEKQNPPISTKTNGKHKMLKNLIDDLKQSKLFDEPKAKQLEAWASIRNAAAHGQFDQFERSDVELMIKGIRDFLADNLLI